MPKPFHQINITQFEELVSSFAWTRQINAVHMHHTWSPARADYRGLPTIESMWDFHVNTNHWSDIAQHISIAPDGSIWTGRGWNTPPASSTGFNGSSSAGPFMFETIGNFDNGKDPFDGAQRATVIAVIRILLNHFKLPVSALKFHNQLNSPKTCPGSSIDYASFCAEVDADDDTRSRGGLTGKRAARPSLSAAQKRLLKPAAAAVAVPGQLSDAELHGVVDCPCCSAEAPPEAAPATASRGTARQWTEAEKALLKRHVVNLRDGRFIESGNFSTSPADVQRIFEELLPAELAKARGEGRPLRVLFWAHGGLGSEEACLTHVMTYHQGWLNAGIYPVYFVWETDHATALHDIFLGAPKEAGTRGFVTDITDAGLEFTLQTVGRPLWRQIKEYAANAVKTPTGGALFAARQLAAFMRQAGAEAELYAMGHSAGSIFHSWFLPAALAAGVPAFKELFLLAPAITVADFKARLAAHIGSGKGIDHCSMFTMTEKAERADNVITIYRKSLLYFVSRACEEASETPILGLQESIFRDGEIRRLFGIDGSGAAGDIVWSPNGSTSDSTTHGGFDNDPHTLHSMVKRMTGADLTPFGAAGARGAGPSDGAGVARRALCIGVDRYPLKPLAGCVNDARQWQQALDRLGFETTLLTDEQATFDGMTQALRKLISGSRAGDHLVFQYAGHGTSVDDVNGDEADGTDEALVPIDFPSGRFFIDDDIGEIIDTLPAGVTLTCFMDCCHSGTNTRAFGFGTTSTVVRDERSRFITVPAEIMIKHVDLRRGMPPKATRGVFEGKPEVLFAACSPKQEAKESGGHGYFTLTAVPLLLEHATKMTNAEFMALVQKKFPTSVKDQDPQLDCAEARKGGLLLGTAVERAVAGAVTALVVEAAAAPPAGEPGVCGAIDPRIVSENMNLYLRLLERLA